CFTAGRAHSIRSRATSGACAPTSDCRRECDRDGWAIAMPDTVVDVVVQIAGEDVLAGRLWAHRRGRVGSATFEYGSEYLRRSDSYELDPVLPKQAGQQQTPEGQALFGAFSDAAP